MSRLDRLKEYANPQHGPHGAASDKENIRFWQDRASENSKLAPRTSDGPMKLPDTGKSMEVRPTEMKAREPRKVNARMAGKDDLNHEGSDYLQSIRREA